MTEYTHISPATLNKLKDCFNQLDLDKDGIIALDDVVKAMILVAQDQRYQLIKQIIREYEGKHQQLNFDDFICIFVRPPPIETQSPLQKLFQQLDRNNSGSIGADQLYQAAKEHGINLQMDQCCELIKWADSSDTGRIQYYQFANIMKKFNHC